MSAERLTPRAQLAELVAGFARQLRWRADRGEAWIPAAPSPRFGAALQPAEPGGATADPDPDRAAPPRSELGVSSAMETPTERLAAVRAALGECERCKLSKGRKRIVFGVGSPQADLMFIGEAPGGEEDRQGEPFVGAAGQLLTKMIGAMGLRRDEVYICNIIKCRPPRNRDPEREEIEACEPFLLRQIEVIAPRMIVALGNFAVKTLLQTTTGITRMRGNWGAYHGIPLMPTFHPAYLLRNAGGKRSVWNDLKAVMAEMDRLGLHRRREGD